MFGREKLSCECHAPELNKVWKIALLEISVEFSLFTYPRNRMPEKFNLANLKTLSSHKSNTTL